MIGHLYDRALSGERCWLRHDDGQRKRLPVHKWIGGHDADHQFDNAIIELCRGKTLDLGCGPGRLVTQLTHRGLPALGIDQSKAAVELARRSGAPALHGDMFDPLPETGRWETVLLVDGNIGVGGDPNRVLTRAGELLSAGGHCIAEFDVGVTGVRVEWMRLESEHSVGPWFQWASVGIDHAAALAQQVGFTLSAIHHVAGRALATLVRR